MRNRIRALLVQGEESPMTELKAVLERQGLATLRLRSCAGVEAVMTSFEPPQLIFTDTILPDGTWADVKNLAERTHSAAPVIVVSRFVDLALYLSVLESGASDFIVPPFSDADLAHVIQCALVGNRTPSGLVRAITGEMPEIIHYAQNHAGSGIRTARSQVGR